MGESDLNLRLRAREMIETVNINPSVSDAFVAFPAGFMEMISFNNSNGYDMYELPMKDIQQLRNNGGSGDIRAYGITSRIEFARSESSVKNYPVTYWKELNLATDLANNILTKYPQLYTYAAMVHAEPWMHDDERIAVWQAMIDNTINTLNRRAKRNLKLLRTELGRHHSGNIVIGYE